jgi:uncharacterized membrane protein
VFPVNRKRIAKGLIILGVAIEFLGTLLVSADLKLAGLALGSVGLVVVVLGYLAWE